MRSKHRLSGTLARLGALVVVACTAVATVAVVDATPSVAAGGPVITNGFASYTVGSTSPPTQFDALTLVSGGASSVNTSSLTIVTQPASGTATAAPTATNGIITYTPASGTTGSQTLTFAYCAPGDTYPNAGNCTTATLTFAPSVGEYIGANVDNLSGVIQDLQTSISLPATAVQGSTVTAQIAAAPTSVPASEDGVSVTSASQFSVILPVPKGFTYVPGTISVTGGDATTSGHFSATYCTTAVDRRLHRPHRQWQLQDRLPLHRDLPEPEHDHRGRRQRDAADGDGPVHGDGRRGRGGAHRLHGVRAGHDGLDHRLGHFRRLSVLLGLCLG